MVEQLPGYDRPADYWVTMKAVLSETLSGEKLDTKYITLREDEAQRLLFEPVLMQLGNKAKRRKDWIPGVTVIKPLDAPVKKSRAKKKAADGASTSECVLNEDAAPPKKTRAKKAAVPDATAVPSDATASSPIIAVVRKSRAKKAVVVSDAAASVATNVTDAVAGGAAEETAATAVPDGETAATAVPGGGVVPAVPAARKSRAKKADGATSATDAVAVGESLPAAAAATLPKKPRASRAKKPVAQDANVS